jgi:hypothetical protein
MVRSPSYNPGSLAIHSFEKPGIAEKFPSISRHSVMSSSLHQFLRHPHLPQPPDQVPNALVNNLTTSEGLTPDPEPPPDPDLARSLEMMAHVIASMSEVPGSKGAIKPCVPDVFDGTDPHDLETFVFQCAMYFSACKGNFRDDQSCALSYLIGHPLDWFQTELTDSITADKDYPPWFASYSAFISELQHLFGPQDPITDAMNCLEVLQYA